MMNQDVIKQKIDLILQNLQKLSESEHITLDELTKDYWKHKALERILEIIINQAIDINQHLIVKSGKGELPFDYKKSFLLLTELGVYPQEFAGKIADSAGLRNVLVHEYVKLDEQIFFTSIRECLSDYTKYCNYILSYLSK